MGLGRRLATLAIDAPQAVCTPQAAFLFLVSQSRQIGHMPTTCSRDALLVLLRAIDCRHGVCVHTSDKIEDG
jgi:hypothetical protein